MVEKQEYPDISRKKVRKFDIPSIGLGTHKLLGKECESAIIDALNIGYRHIDTAQSYDNEQNVGNAIKDSSINREELFITTKIWFDKLQPEKLKESFETSLDKLQMDYVDLLLVHWPPVDENGSFEAALDAMRDLRRKGLIRKSGVSNFTPKLLMKAITHDEIVTNQVEYHPFLAQNELLEICKKHDLALTAYAPIAQGKIFNNSVIRGIGEKHGKNEAQVTLRWLIQQPRVVAIPRSSDKDHIKSNFDIFDFELSEEEMQKIGQLDEGKRLIDPEFAPNWGESYEKNDRTEVDLSPSNL
jgi:diketogulonate reductase-like aldo/keto reductase